MLENENMNEAETPQLNIGAVSGSTALEPKVVNHGNVFGTKNWYTFYCPHCGSQITNRSSNCEGSFPTKGCNGAIKWNEK